jgi:glycosyltransferase involved in cell wall biosynthesis
LKPNEKIRVLHVTQAVGGIKTYITGIVSASDNARYEYGIACPLSDLYSWAIENNIPGFRVNFVRRPSLFSDTKSLIEVIRVVRSFKPHILHAHSGKGGFIGRLAGRITRTPTVFTPNAFSYLGFTGIQRTLYLLLERLARPWTSVLLAVSESERSRAILDLGYRELQVRVVANSINVSAINSISGGGDLKNRVGMVGRLLYQKNPEMFLRVAKSIHARFPDVRFCLLGEGYHDFSRDRIYHLVQELDESSYVSIMKWGAHSDAAEFLRSCDIYLSTSHFEGLPFTILEAMAYGIPVIATNVDGARDIITDGDNGFLVEDDNVEAMADRVTALLEDPRLRRTITAKARSIIEEKFDLLKNIRRIEDVYSSFH